MNSYIFPFISGRPSKIMVVKIYNVIFDIKSQKNILNVIRIKLSFCTFQFSIKTDFFIYLVKISPSFVSSPLIKENDYK